MASIAALNIIVVILGLYSLKLLLHLLKGNRPPLPPGPTPKPIIGNLADLPSPGEPEWKYWVKYKDLYGSYA